MLRLNSQNIEQALNITPAISNTMVDAIEEWTDMYEDKAPWLHPNPTFNDPTMVVSLGLPAFIASEKARMATLELKSEITAPKTSEEQPNPEYFPPKVDQFGQVQASGQEKTVIVETTKGPEERAKYLNEQYHNKLLSKIRTQLEYGIAKGSLIIKPYVIKKKLDEVAGVESTGQVEDSYDIDFDFIQADCFYPFAFDSSGNLSEVAFIQTKTDKDTLYTRLEYHKLEGNKVTILNKAFKQLNGGQSNHNPKSASLGTEVPLSAVYEWKDLLPKAEVQNVDRLLFGYFKMPEANTIDPHSPLGISGFARAKTLIREADKQYSRLLWEYEGGELAVDIDRDALRTVNDGKGNPHQVASHLQQRLFRNVDVDINGETYNVFAPQLRDGNMINGLNAILMRIEDVCALSRGTISEVAAEARTATELKILRQRSFSSNLDIQKALEAALKDVIYTMNTYCTIYNIVGDTPRTNNGVDTSKMGDYEVSFEWDDSIIVDEDIELQRRISLMEKGIASRVETRMWYYGETEKQAREALSKINEESMRAIEQNMVASSQMGKNIQNGEVQNENQSPQNAQQKQALSKNQD